MGDAPLLAQYQKIFQWEAQAKRHYFENAVGNFVEYVEKVAFDARLRMGGAGSDAPWNFTPDAWGNCKKLFFPGPMPMQMSKGDAKLLYTRCIRRFGELRESSELLDPNDIRDICPDSTEWTSKGPLPNAILRHDRLFWTLSRSPLARKKLIMDCSEQKFTSLAKLYDTPEEVRSSLHYTVPCHAHGECVLNPLLEAHGLPTVQGCLSSWVDKALEVMPSLERQQTGDGSLRSALTQTFLQELGRPTSRFDRAILSAQKYVAKSLHDLSLRGYGHCADAYWNFEPGSPGSRKNWIFHSKLPIQMSPRTARHTHDFFHIRFRPLLSIAKESQHFVVARISDLVGRTRKLSIGGQSVILTGGSTHMIDQYYPATAGLEDGGGEENVYDELKADAISDIPAEKVEEYDEEIEEYDPSGDRVWHGGSTDEGVDGTLVAGALALTNP